jgi:Tfp pilus assembly PilM family ATPase
MNDIRCAGINLTNSWLQFVEVEKISDQIKICNIGQTFISPLINFEGNNEARLLEQLQTAFDEIKIRNPISSTNVSFTLPPELFITLQLPYDASLNQKEIREEFNWEISQLFPFIPVEDLAIKFYDLDNSLLPGRNNAIVVGLNKKYLILIKKFCLNNNLTPKLVDNASIAANSFINTYHLSDINSLTVNIYNARNSITLFLNIDSKPAYVKSFQKRDDEFINKIINEISLENIKEAVTQKLRSAVLTGEDIGGDLLYDLQKGTGLEFERVNPFNIIGFKTGLHISEISAEQFGSFTSAAAIASRFN